MPEIAPANSVSTVSLVRRGSFRSEERAEGRLGCLRYFEQCANLAPELGLRFQTKQFVHPTVVKRDAKMVQRFVFEPRRAEHERPIISLQNGNHQALRRP